MLLVLRICLNQSRINDRVAQAVEETRGVVVTYQGQFINGWFFADGGGQTSASAEGLAILRKKLTSKVSRIRLCHISSRK